MPDLVKVHQSFRDRNVQVIAVCLDLVTHGQETAADVEAFVRAREIDLPVVALTGGLEAAQETFQLGQGIPVTVVYAGGRRAAVHRGPATLEEFSALIDGVLGD
jgi:hypothetical protein